MLRLKRIIVFIVVVSILLIGFKLVRGGESAEVGLVKKACHVIKGEDGKFEVENWKKLFPDFKSWSFKNEDPQKILDVHNYFAREVTHATQAAQINLIWRPLADAQIDAMNNLYLAYLLVVDNPNNDRIYDVMPTLNAALIKVGIECVAFRERLNA
jgi:hypothetical protein